MSTIPASAIVNVIPSVLAAAGAALDINGVVLTTSTRVPIGTVPSFASASDVSDYFGPTSQEASLAGIYFSGFTNSTSLPGAMLFAQYPASAVSAYVRGADISAMTLGTLQGLSGTMTIVADGTTHAGSVNLAAATGFSSAASIIQTALNGATSVTGSVAANVVTGSIAVNSTTGSIAGTTLTVSAVASGVLVAGQTISGTGVVNGTTIVAQLTGTAGSTGTYQVSISQTVASTTITGSGGGLTVTAVTTGTLAVGQTITGSGVTASTTITALATGAGGTGKYAVNISQTVSSTTITASGGTLTVTAVSTGVLAVGDIIAGTGVTVGNTITALITGTGGTGTYFVSVGDTASSTTITVAGAGIVATYDSVTGAFVITSGTTGALSTMAFPTGAISTSLLLTSVTGAVLSQGAAAAAPAAFMTSLIGVTTNWVTFMTAFDPDVSGSTNKQAFAAWKDTQNDRFAYIVWDTDVTPEASSAATSSLGYILQNNGDSGSCVIWASSATQGAKMAAFICGAAASINFEQKAGRITFAGKWQGGLTADVTSETVANNLIANGYNFGGAYGAANQNFVFFQNGQCTGDFAWLDSYINQIQLNNSFQIALLTLIENSLSIPYSTQGNTLIEAALGDPVAAGLNFGTFGPGTITAAQAVAVNTDAGANVAQTLQTRGSYLQVLNASAVAQAARSSPPCTFFYLDRGSVQKITLASIALQ